jgi:hypothetical protein
LPGNDDAINGQKVTRRTAQRHPSGTLNRTKRRPVFSQKQRMPSLFPEIVDAGKDGILPPFCLKMINKRKKTNQGY